MVAVDELTCIPYHRVVNSKLFAAIERHDPDSVSKLLSNGANPNAFECYSEYIEPITPLLVATYESESGGPTEVITLLLRAGAEVNFFGPLGQSALASAIRDRCPLDVKLVLLAAGADPNIKDSMGNRPYHWAILNGDVELTALLLRCGAYQTINESGGVELGGGSALSWTCRELHLPLVATLLDWGANPDIELDFRDAFQSLPKRDKSNAIVWDKIESLLRTYSSKTL